MVKTVGKYELYRTLGEGSFGKVKYAVNKDTNEAVAIKILDKDKIQKQNMGAQIKKEISIMRMIKHDNVVCVKDVFATTTKIFIVLELVEGGELFDKITSQGRLSETQARFYFRQIVEGLHHCHSQGVCHRDLKPENLLLDAQGNIKISDFGLSALYVGDADSEGNSRTELLHTTCGTPNYVAPEVLANHGYDGKRADVWSMGVILYVLLAGFLPFEENTMIALFLKIKNADFTYPSWFSPEIRKLLDRILVSDPALRLTLDELKHHSWVAEGIASKEPSSNTRKDSETKGHKNTTEAVEQSRREAAEVHARLPTPASTRLAPLNVTSSNAPSKTSTILEIDSIMPTLQASKTPDSKRNNSNIGGKRRQSTGSRNVPLSAPLNLPPSTRTETKSNEQTASHTRHPAQAQSHGIDPTVASRRNSKNSTARTSIPGSGPGSGSGSGSTAQSSASSSVSGNGGNSLSSESAAAQGALNTTHTQSCCSIA